MKHQVSRLFAILLSLLAVFSVITPVAFCDDGNVKPVSGAKPGELGAGTISVGGYDEISPIELLDYSLIEQSGNGVTSGRVTYSHYNDNGKLAWTVTLRADFYFDGNNAQCTGSDLSVNVYSAGSGWSKKSGGAARSGNKAYTNNVVMSYKSALVEVLTKKVNLSITCDENGKMR